MRWSGLAIRDAVTLERAEIIQDEAKGIYRIVTARQKTGTHVSVPVPAEVAKELLAVPNSNERYVFWTGRGSGETIAKTWASRYVRPVFEAARIPCELQNWVIALLRKLKEVAKRAESESWDLVLTSDIERREIGWNSVYSFQNIASWRPCTTEYFISHRPPSRVWSPL